MQLFSSYAYSKQSSRDLANFLMQRFSSPPILLCIGTDRILADCLGPLSASILRQNDYPNFIYGGLSMPITHQNAEFACDYIHTMHPYSPLVVIDSMATKSQCRLGHIIIRNDYIGAVNSLSIKANLFIYGVTSILAQNKLQNARLNNLKTLADSITEAFCYMAKNTQKINQKLCKKYKTNI